MSGEQTENDWGFPEEPKKAEPGALALLNEPQALAAGHEGGPLLIFAGAGSGKTRTITYRIANLVANYRVPPYRILAVTFTNKAAQEMRERLIALTGESIARDLWIGTFHGTSAKLLRRYHEEVGLGSNFVIYDDSDQKALLSRIIKAQGLDDRLYQPKPILARISALKREGKDPAVDDIDDGFDSNLVRLGQEYQAALKRCNAVDFDDLLLYVLRIVENPDSVGGAELRRRYSHVLVDEFQDTNWVQYRIVRALSAASRNLCVVGDDDQSIYRWRGADVRIIRGFREDFPETLVVKLEQNYRSTGNIVRAALGVIEPCRVREPKKLWTSEADGDAVIVRACSDERAEAAFVASGIAQARAQGVPEGEIAVFYRIHAQSRVLEESLRGAGVPYQIIGGMKFFERAEVKDLLSYLRLVENPNSDPDFLRIINVPARGIGQKSVEQLADLAAENTTTLTEALKNGLSDGTLSGALAKKLTPFHQLLGNLQEARTKLGPADLLERILEETGYKKLLEKDDTPESDARLENLAELVGSVREYEDEAPETGEEPTLIGYLERVSLVSPTDAMDDSPKVSLMTVHGAKGLEFGHVFLTGMEEETFPYRGLDGTDPEELDEERRLAYVAITRARKRLFITHVGSRFLFGKTRYLSPSRFLADLPEEGVEKTGSAGPNLPGFSGLGARAGGGFGGNSGRAFFGQRSWGGGQRAPSPWEQKSALSPGGRSTVNQMKLAPGERVVDRDEFSDVPPDEAMDAASDDREPVVVRPGQKVTHKKFGRGVVERLEVGAKPTVVARFPGHGPKRILAEFLDFE